MWNKRSLRTQIAIITSLIIAIALVVSGLLTIFLFRDAMVNDLDHKIGGDAQDVATVSRYIAERPDSEGSQQAQAVFSLSGYSTAIYNSEGKITKAITNRLGYPDLDNESPQWLESNENKGITYNGQNANENAPKTDWRVMYYAVTTDSGQKGWIAIALPMGQVDDVVYTVMIIIVMAAAALFLLTSMLAFWFVTRAFKPLKAINKTVEQISSGDLSQRIPLKKKQTESEIGHLAFSLNSMFSQIERLFKDQQASETKTKQFVSDASHELRTPLVPIQGYAELYRQGGLTKDEDIAVAMDRIESEAKRMSSLVEGLLTLTRGDEKLALNFEPLDLQITALDAVNDTRASAPGRKISLEKLKDSESMSAPTRADTQRIHQIVANLVSNALRYTPDNSPIEIASGNTTPESNDGFDSDRVSVIQVIDHGPGIPTASLEKIFERFYRDDPSRDRETGGSGLGLAIVSSLVGAHGGTIRASHTPGGGATMTVKLPYSPLESAQEEFDNTVDDILDTEDYDIVKDPEPTMTDTIGIKKSINRLS